MAQLTWEPALCGFIRSVLRKLSSVQEKGFGSRFHNFDPALKQLEQKLSQFQDLLIDAERRKINKEQSVTSWMDDLNSLVYDIEDIVEEINIHWHMIQVGTFQAAEGTSEAPDSFMNIWYMTDELNNKIQKNLGSLDDLAKVADVTLKLKRDMSIENWKSFQPKLRHDTSPVVDESEVYGREKDKEAIIELLLSSGSNSKKNYVVFSIVGMGGMGKTTLAQLVFEDERVKSFFDVRSWVCVSEVFDVAKVTKEIIEYATNDNESLKHFGLNYNHFSQPSLAVLQTTLKKIISKKRLLLVLDDVWTAEEWDKLKAPFNCCANDSKILVTSRFKDVTNAISSRKQYGLGVLDDQPSWDIFKKRLWEKLVGN